MAFWTTKVLLTAQKFGGPITDCKGSETTWEFKMAWMGDRRSLNSHSAVVGHDIV